MKPTPTDHLIHWLNCHPEPGFTLPGTSIRLCDAHDDLVAGQQDFDDLLADNEHLEEELTRVSRKFHAVCSKASASLREVIPDLPTTGDSAHHLNQLLEYLQNQE